MDLGEVPGRSGEPARRQPTGPGPVLTARLVAAIRGLTGPLRRFMLSRSSGRGCRARIRAGQEPGEGIASGRMPDSGSGRVTGGDLMAREWDVPGYTEVKVLGSGGFGEVVLARHDASGTLVAIKYLRRELLADPEFAGMFRSEAAVLASVEDPNVVRLYEYVESPAGAAIVMELVEGVALREILTRQGQTSA